MKTLVLSVAVLGVSLISGPSADAGDFSLSIGGGPTLMAPGYYSGYGSGWGAYSSYGGCYGQPVSPYPYGPAYGTFGTPYQSGFGLTIGSQHHHRHSGRHSHHHHHHHHH